MPHLSSSSAETEVCTTEPIVTPLEELTDAVEAMPAPVATGAGIASTASVSSSRGVTMGSVVQTSVSAEDEDRCGISFCG